MSDALLRILVKPRAARAGIEGERSGRVTVKVTAPPAEGKANEAVRALLAKRLRVAKSRVEITAGRSARMKSVRVQGLTTAEALRRLGLRTS